MRTRKLFLMASSLTILGLLRASCAPAIAPTPTPKPGTLLPGKASVVETPTPISAALTPTTKPAADQPKYGGILERANYQDPVQLDIHQETVASVHISLANCYSGLTKYDTIEVDKVVPDLAERWEVSADGAIWTFHLRKGVQWHDGKPFTAEDAKFSLERMAFWKEHKIVSPRAGAMLTAVKSVDAPDENTVRVTLQYPSASFINNLPTGFVLILPKHVIQAKGDMKKDVVGTGPFIWKSFSPGTVIELVKNPQYFVKGRPYLDGIRIFTVKDPSTRFAAFRTGRVKMTGIGSQGLSHGEAEMVRKEMADVAIVHTYSSIMPNLLLTRVAKAPWSDIRVRKALHLAVDRQAAIKINFNVGSMGAAMDPGGVWGIPERELKEMPGYRQPKDADIAEAKRLMGEAGYPRGFETSMLVRVGGTVEKLAIFAKDQLTKIGIDAKLEVKENTAVYELFNRHTFEIASSYFAMSADDPDIALGGFYVTGGSQNYGDFSDQQVDGLFDKQARTIDPTERKKVVRQIQEKLLDLVPYPILFWDAINLAHWKEVRGYKPGTGNTSHNVLVDVWLAK